MSNHRPRKRIARTLLCAGAGLMAVTVIGCASRTVSNPFFPEPPADLSPAPVFGTADLPYPSPSDLSPADHFPYDGNPLPPDLGPGDLGGNDLESKRG